MGGPQNKFGATLRLSKLLNTEWEALIIFINKLLDLYSNDHAEGEKKGLCKQGERSVKTIGELAGLYSCTILV